MMSEVMVFILWVFALIFLIVSTVGLIVMIVGDHENDKVFRETLRKWGK